MAISNTLLLFLLIVVALVAIAALWGLVALKRQLAEQELIAGVLQKDLRALVSAAVGVGERVKKLESMARELNSRQEELGVRQDRIDRTGDEERSYEQAIKMAQKGAPIEDLMDVCGLARGEAELIAMMHRLDTNA